MKRSTILSFALLAAIGLSQPVFAQSGGFSPVFTVNGSPVTGFEYEQRRQFLTLLRAPGDIDALTRQALIEDRIRLHAAKQLGVTISADQVKAGMEEFASRANLTAEQFIEALKQGGVEAESFRDFVSAGLIWREVVRAKFAGTFTVSDADIDRALAAESGRGNGPRILLSEIVLPAQQGGFAPVRAKAEKLAETIRSSGDFARVARENSAAASRENGGQIGWMPVSNLPPQVRGALATLGTGQISEPVIVPGGVALFQVRAVDQGGTEVPAGSVRVEFVRATLPADVIADAQASVRACEELFPLARKAGVAGLTRQTSAENALPGDIAAAVRGLDVGEIAVIGGSQVVMLCSRTATIPEGGAPDIANLPEPVLGGPPRIVKELGFSAGPNREAVRQELVNQRLNQLSDGYMAELVSQAIVQDAP